MAIATFPFLRKQSTNHRSDGMLVSKKDWRIEIIEIKEHTMPTYPVELEKFYRLINYA